MSEDLPRIEATSGSGRYATATARGSIQVFVSSALLLPTGLVTAAVLTRVLGREGYGLFTLAATLISTVAWSLSSILERPSISVVAAAEDWLPRATAVLRTHLVGGTISAAVFWLGAGALSTALSATELTVYLRLFACELVVFAPAQAYGAVLVARGRFAGRALGTAARWIARMVLMVGLVLSGLAVTGAILGSIGGFLVELIVYRRLLRLPLFLRSGFSASRLWTYGAPLMVFGLCLRVFSRFDLLALKGFGGTMADAGVYGAAQNLAIIPVLVASSFSPLLLGTLTRMWSEGHREACRRLATDSLRLSIGLFPFAAAAAGAAGEIVTLLFGREFAASGPILGRLIVAEVGLVVVAVASVVLIVEDRRRWLSLFGLALLGAAAAGHAIAVPRFGALGAATVTMSLALGGAGITCLAAYGAWRIRPPLPTLVRTAVVSGAAYLFTAAWPTPGLLVAVKLLLAVVGIPTIFIVLGEIGRREWRFMRDLGRDLIRLEPGTGGPETIVPDRPPSPTDPSPPSP